MAGNRIPLDYVPDETESEEDELGDDPHVTRMFLTWFLKRGLPCIVDPSGLPCPVKSSFAISGRQPAGLGITVPENVEYIQELWRICASERLVAIREDREARDKKRKKK